MDGLLEKPNVTLEMILNEENILNELKSFNLPDKIKSRKLSRKMNHYFNMVFADVSILTSTGMVYYLFQSSFADGFKIGLSFFFLLSGVARFLCAVFSSEEMENNIAIIVFMCFIAIEAISYFAAKYLSSK